MRNFFLLIFSVALILCFSEIIVRYMRLPILLAMHDRNPATEVTKYGYFNPSSGIDQPNPDAALQYHYYSPHLRDTPVDLHATHILVLGDSFTFGLHLPWNRTYIYQMQANIDNTFGKRHYQLLNAGTAGWGTSNYLSYLEHYGHETLPKFVLVFLNSDDIGRSIKLGNYDNLVSTNQQHISENKHSTVNSSFLAFKQKLFHSWLFKKSELFHLLYFEGLSLFHHYQYGKIDPALLPPMSSDLVFQDEFAELYAEALFHRMNLWCQSNHAKLLVVTTGFNALYPKDAHDPTKSFLLHAKDFFAREGIPYYDMALVFKKTINGKDFQIPKDGHPNEYGAQVIAQLALPWLKQQINN